VGVHLVASSGLVPGFTDVGDGIVEVRAVDNGDANVDGVVIVADLGMLASNYNVSFNPFGGYWDKGALSRSSSIAATPTPPELGGPSFPRKEATQASRLSCVCARLYG
jgi:hypothetical protein